MPLYTWSPAAGAILGETFRRLGSSWRKWVTGSWIAQPLCLSSVLLCVAGNTQLQHVPTWWHQKLGLTFPCCVSFLLFGIWHYCKCVVFWFCRGSWFRDTPGLRRDSAFACVNDCKTAKGHRTFEVGQDLFCIMKKSRAHGTRKEMSWRKCAMHHIE